jgi:NTP pyrophosphatase (non-canonical NTP hydrolase)
MPDSRFRLDELYKMTAHIYSEQNAHRPASATFSHFVEVCGLLTVHARKKKRESTTFEDALCKALGWYFPLLAKFKVASVEELVYRKFPYTCPYCRECPHVDGSCKTVRGTNSTVNHADLIRKYSDNRAMRPAGLNDWQRMFDKIYPRHLENDSRSVVGLFEELGELAEAVRVFDRYPKYFAGEAADVFSYLMGLANEYSLQLQRDDKGIFDFEAEYLKRFPGLCVQCGYPICICPSVPEATVGRMAKELDVHDLNLFITSFDSFRDEAKKISNAVLESLGGYDGLAARFPFDRGEANHSLVMFCLKLAAQVEDSAIAERLRSAALKIAESATYAGSPKHPQVLAELREPLREILEANDVAKRTITDLDDTGISGAIRSIVISELTLGDKYVSSNPIAQGANVQVMDRGFALAWQKLRSTTDLDQLVSDMQILRNEIGTMPVSTETIKAGEALTRAESEAKKGKGEKVLETLSVLGKWVVDVGLKLGAEVAVKLITTAHAVKL